MQIVLLIWSMGKKHALTVFISNLLFISCCWNFIFISSCWMTKPDDGRDGKTALISPTLLSLVADEFSAGGSACCFCLLALLYFRVFQASVQVIEVAAVPTHWSGYWPWVSSWFSLSSSLPSSLGCRWLGGPLWNCDLNTDAYCLTGLSCSPAPPLSAPAITSPCTGGLGDCSPSL